MDEVITLLVILTGLICGCQFADFHTIKDMKKDIKDLQEKVKKR